MVSLWLPKKETLVRILRYETAVERQLYRALNELIRLQTARQGGKTPPPLALDIDLSGKA